MPIKAKGVSNAISLNSKQIVSIEELLMSQVVQQEALTRLLIGKRYLQGKGFWRW
jgi:hypothetical protein